MFTYEAVLVVAMLSCPEPIENKNGVGDWALLTRPSVMATCIEAQILDPRERDHYFTTIANKFDDLAYLQGKYKQCVNLPTIQDGKMFPSRQIINDYLSFNRAYKGDLQKRLVIDPCHHDMIKQAIWDNDRLYEVWDMLRDAQCDYYYITVRRQALQNLRETIGPENYYRSIMPPHVAHWYFQ